MEKMIVSIVTLLMISACNSSHSANQGGSPPGPGPTPPTYVPPSPTPSQQPSPEESCGYAFADDVDNASIGLFWFEVSGLWISSDISFGEDTSSTDASKAYEKDGYEIDLASGNDGGKFGPVIYYYSSPSDPVSGQTTPESDISKVRLSKPLTDSGPWNGFRIMEIYVDDSLGCRDTLIKRDGNQLLVTEGTFSDLGGGRKAPAEFLKRVSKYGGVMRANRYSGMDRALQFTNVQKK